MKKYMVKKFKKDELPQYIKHLIKKYGCWVTATPEVVKEKRKRYVYQEIYFDSSWELALYIYAIDHNEEIVREPLRFEYYYDNKVFYYYPDFLYNG